MKTVFKVGDVVYDNTMMESKGDVIEITNSLAYPIRVRFGDDLYFSYTLDGRITEKYNKTLSFTPYEIKVNQERPIELPEVGEEIMVSNDNLAWFLQKFESYREGFEYPIIVKNDSNCYKYFKRLR